MEHITGTEALPWVTQPLSASFPLTSPVLPFTSASKNRAGHDMPAGRWIFPHTKPLFVFSPSLLWEILSFFLIRFFLLWSNSYNTEFMMYCVEVYNLVHLQYCMTIPARWPQNISIAPRRDPALVSQVLPVALARLISLLGPSLSTLDGPCAWSWAARGSSWRPLSLSAGPSRLTRVSRISASSLLKAEWYSAWLFSLLIHPSHAWTVGLSAPAGGRESCCRDRLHACFCLSICVVFLWGDVWSELHSSCLLNSLTNH